MVGFDSSVSHQFTSHDYQIAGAVSGFCTRLLLQPLDVIKIRFQLQLEPISKANSSSKYNGMFQAVRTIYKEEGYRSFWKGHVPAQGLSVTYGVVQFTCFEHLTAALFPYLPSNITSGSLKPFFHFGCGGVSGCTAALFAHPLDVIRTRFVSQGEPKVYKGFYHAVQCMYKEAGVSTFYRGLGPTMLQVFPLASFQFAFYAFFNKVWIRLFKGNSKTKGPVQTLVCGGLSGMSAKTIIYPLDLTKKRLEVQGFEQARLRFGRVQSYENSIDCLRTMFKEEGLLALYKGLKPSVIKSACTISLAFTFYESTLAMIADYDKKR